MGRSVEDRAFLSDFASMSAFGAIGNGGVDRQAGSEADARQRAWLAELVGAEGFRTEYDRIGNQFCLRELVEGAPYVLIGSHMDSQPTAGRFDGAYGVLAGAHAAFRVCRDLPESPRYNIGVVNWFNEEGSRFSPSMMGSGVYTGLLDVQSARQTRDRFGVAVGDVLAQAGQISSGLGPEAAAYLEIHVEQGRVLEDSGTTIGLVEATWAANKYRIVVEGEQSHSGSTLMGDRRDALFAAALLVVFAREIADEHPGLLHTAIGQLDVYPNSPVVVASRVELLLDVRSPSRDLIESVAGRLDDEIARISLRAGVAMEVTMSHSWSVNPYPVEGYELAADTAAELQLSATPMMTIAGHDSTNLKEIVPTVMLFVPSVDGVSHNEAELTRDDDMLAGVRLITAVLAKAVEGALDGRSAG